ncbi:DUF4405 domain-containing protein [Thermococcus sp.]
MKAAALLRGVVDLLLLLVFTVLAITGIGLYLAPRGRIAEAIGWTFLGVNRETLTAVHTYFGFAMIGLVGLHLSIGFRSMIAMLRMGLRKRRARG